MMYKEAIKTIFDIVIEHFNLTYNDDVIAKITIEDIIDKNKTAHIVIARSVIVNQLIKYGFDIATCSSIMNRTKTSIRNLLKIYNSNINNKLYNDLYNNIDNACKNAMKNFIKEH